MENKQFLLSKDIGETALTLITQLRAKGLIKEAIEVLDKMNMFCDVRNEAWPLELYNPMLIYSNLGHGIKLAVIRRQVMEALYNSDIKPYEEFIENKTSPSQTQ